MSHILSWPNFIMIRSDLSDWMIHCICSRLIEVTLEIVLVLVLGFNQIIQLILLLFQSQHGISIHHIIMRNEAVGS